MSLTDAFNSQEPVQSTESPAPEPKKKRPAPFCLRLSEAERTRLKAEADGAPLGAYIKAKVLGSRRRFSEPDRATLAQLLAQLGRSRIANNLNQLAYAANIGSLPVTPETEADLKLAIAEVRDMRRLLLVALGMKPEGAQ